MLYWNRDTPASSRIAWNYVVNIRMPAGLDLSGKNWKWSARCSLWYSGFRWLLQTIESPIRSRPKVATPAWAHTISVSMSSRSRTSSHFAWSLGNSGRFGFFLGFGGGFSALSLFRSSSILFSMSRSSGIFAPFLPLSIIP